MTSLRLEVKNFVRSLPLINQSNLEENFLKVVLNKVQGQGTNTQKIK
jgi:hypothetical protein